MLRGESSLIGQSCGFHLALELCQAGEGKGASTREPPATLWLRREKSLSQNLLPGRGIQIPKSAGRESSGAQSKASFSTVTFTERLLASLPTSIPVVSVRQSHRNDKMKDHFAWNNNAMNLYKNEVHALHSEVTASRTIIYRSHLPSSCSQRARPLKLRQYNLTTSLRQ